MPARPVACRSHAARRPSNAGARFVIPRSFHYPTSARIRFQIRPLRPSHTGRHRSAMLIAGRSSRHHSVIRRAVCLRYAVPIPPARDVLDAHRHRYAAPVARFASRFCSIPRTTSLAPLIRYILHTPSQWPAPSCAPRIKLGRPRSACVVPIAAALLVITRMKLVMSRSLRYLMRERMLRGERVGCVLSDAH